MKIGGGDGCLLLAGEAFAWRPWEAGSRGGGGGGKKASAMAGMLNTKGQWGVENEAWGALDLVWPRPGNTAPLHALVPFSTPAYKLYYGTAR